MVIEALFLFGLAAVSSVVIWKSSSYFEDSADKLAAYYGLPGIVQGAVIAAVGSSMPEISATVLSALRGEFEIGVGAIVGSAVFNILVIPALSVLYNGGTVEIDRDIVYKETQFYMVSVATLLLTFSFAVIYNPVGGRDLLEGRVTRLLAAVPLLLYLLYVFIQYLDTADYDAPESDVSPAKNWAVLAVSLGVIVVGVEGLVRSAEGLGEVFDTPAFFWSLIVVAAGTSLPDAFVSVEAMRSGKGTVSLANVLGSNTFDLLVAVPAGIMIVGTDTVVFSHVVPMMGFLVLATVVLFVFLRTDLKLSRREAYLLLGVYGVFVVWILAESVGAVGLVR
ncbi:MAG: sodium:calcium antiporter [Halobacteria archaeon]|nr:sodium:calcium antiporter [Halobacteria archaeon]